MKNKELQKHEIAVRNKHTGVLEIMDIYTGEIIVSSVTPINKHEYAFNYAKAIAICQYIKQGMTLNEIAKQEDMPPLDVISHWQRSDRMFAEEMKLARTARAEFHHEKVLDIAKKAADGEYGKDEVPGIKLGTDLYKWSAERANPEKYGNKVTHEGSTEKPILMRVINTGISRAPRPDVVETQSQEVSDVPEAEFRSTEPGHNPTPAKNTPTIGDEGGESGPDRRKITTGITRNNPIGSNQPTKDDTDE